MNFQKKKIKQKNKEKQKELFEYQLKLAGFGTEYSEYGKVDIEIPEKTLKDLYGNYNEITKVYKGNYSKEQNINIGNPSWKEPVEPKTDYRDPIYTAFREGVVDFIKPEVEFVEYFE